MATEASFEQLKHPNPYLRERAMLEIAESRDENTIPKLMSALDDEDVTYRRAAVKALGVIGVDAVTAIADGLLNSPNVTVRGSCAKALAQVALNYPDLPFPEEGLQGLKRALHDTNPVVHIASAMALGEMGAPAYPILTEALQTTEDIGAQVSIVNAIASIGDPRAVELLTTLSEDASTDSYVQETATSALSRLDLVMNYKRSDA
jgi:bilin biosynthesis protein